MANLRIPLGGGAGKTGTAAPGRSVIFVTLHDGEYNDYWLSETRTLMATDEIAGYRDMHWCGQRKKNDRDHLVRTGTLVAVRAKKSERFFTLVGTVAEMDLLTLKGTGVPATYKLMIEMWETPHVIHRANGDRCVHWTVLRELGIPRSAGYQPEGIYSS